MKRRNFISMLAGIVAVPAAIKALFGNQHSVTVKDVGGPEFKGPDFSIDYSKIEYRWVDRFYGGDIFLVTKDNEHNIPVGQYCDVEEAPHEMGFAITPRGGYPCFPAWKSTSIKSFNEIWGLGLRRHRSFKELEPNFFDEINMKFLEKLQGK